MTSCFLIVVQACLWEIEEVIQRNIEMLQTAYGQGSFNIEENYNWRTVSDPSIETKRMYLM